jgi:tetratricopeptide (TPR) repeat protein
MKLATLFIALSLVHPLIAQDANEAKIAVQQGRWGEAEQLIGDPSDEQGLYLLGRAQLGLKNIDVAETTFNRILEANGESSLGHEGMAGVYNARKDYTRAFQSATRAVELNPENPGAYYILGVVQAFRKETPQAIASFQKSVALDDGDAYAHYNLGLLQYQQRKFDQTVIHFERFVAIAPGAPEAGQVNSILRTVRGR